MLVANLTQLQETHLRCVEPPISTSEQYLVFPDPFVDPSPTRVRAPHVHACRGHRNTPELRKSTQHNYNEPVCCVWNHSLDCRSSITCSHPPTTRLPLRPPPVDGAKDYPQYIRAGATITSHHHSIPLTLATMYPYGGTSPIM